MATFNALTTTGVNSDSLFPALHSGGFTVIETAVNRYSIKFNSDGLIVRFVAEPGSSFTYSGTTPIGGRFTEIDLATGGPISTTLATWTDLASTSLSQFNSPGLADTLLSGVDTLNGNSGNDILRGHGDADLYIGNSGNDLFIIDKNSDGVQIHGALANGSEGNDEIDTIKVLGTFTAAIVSNIDAITFAATSNATATFNIVSGVVGLSTALRITGDGHTNIIYLPVQDDTGFALDISNWRFTAWTQGVDRVIIGASGNDDTIIGTNFADDLDGGGGADIFIGKGGNDIFYLTGGSDPAAIHGCNADGSGGQGETNLIRVGDSYHDLSHTLLTNISGFQFFGTDAKILFAAVNGLITDRIGPVIKLDASQLASGIKITNIVVGDFAGRTAAFEITGGSVDASAWQLTNISASSVLHVTGTAGIDVMRGWEATDVMVLGGGDDQAFGNGGSDWLYGEAGRDLLIGGIGKDFLTGGLDADRFDFNALRESRKGADRDVINDFHHSEHDKIDLRTIDAERHTPGNQAFHLIGSHRFSHDDGELRIVKKAGYVLVQGDVNGDGRADFQIEVHGTGSLLKGDFIM